MNINKLNRGSGAGGAKTNLNGINFEQDVYLGKWIENAGFFLNDLSLRKDRIQISTILDDQKQVIGIYGRQGKIYEALKFWLDSSFSNEYIALVFSAKIYPDAFIINFSRKTLYIFEKKWQQSSGSVDEKIQTGPFKLEMFQKLLKQFGVKVEYNYVLSDYYKNKKFRNVKDYYKEKHPDIKVWVAGENLEYLDISCFLKD